MSECRISEATYLQTGHQARHTAALDAALDQLVAQTGGLAPGEELPLAAEGHRELGARKDALHPRQGLDQDRLQAAVAVAVAQLAVVAIAPGVYQALGGEGQRMGIAAAQGHVHHHVLGQGHHQRGQVAVVAVAMAQAGVGAAAPGEQVAAAGDGRAVGAAAEHRLHAVLVQSGDLGGHGAGMGVAMAQAVVLASAPRVGVVCERRTELVSRSLRKAPRTQAWARLGVLF